MRPEIICGERMAAPIAKAFDDALNADVYAVLHLNREVDGHRGDRTLYEREATAFMVRLAKRIRGKSVYRRLRPQHRLLPNEITIEKLGDGPHLNVLMRKPAHCDFDKFREALLGEWRKSPWAATDERSAYCEPRQDGSGLTGYCYKEGDEALVHRTLTF